MKMDTLRSASHLQREIGDELFAALVNSDNTAAVRKFAATLVKSALPTEMTVGGVTYEILSFLKGDEKSVVGHTMVERAKEMGANLGEEDCERFLKNQSDIPAALCGKVAFVFPDLRHPDDREYVADLDWGGDGWYLLWGWLSRDWRGRGRLLRRK
ncbi:hypothetical protein HZB93_03580 [Candidatus Falkowbacteria bacterium]|nr:hypothetical protein [Candidatus Falkowbacteria bacterium]